MAGMKIEIALFDGFDEMDAVGPFEVLSNAAERGAPIDVELVGAHGAGTVVASHGLRVAVDRGPSEAPDLLLVPGGGWSSGTSGVRDEIERGVLPRALAAAHEAGSTVGSVCTGAMLLAAAGLVEGRPAITHHDAVEDLRAAGAQVADDARFVDDGDIVTAGGVTSGLDLALYLVEKAAGPSIAAQVAADIEYERRLTAV